SIRSGSMRLRHSDDGRANDVNTDLMTEGKLMTLAEAASQHPAFRDFHPATLTRWARKGLSRGGRVVKLEALFCGQTLKTRAAARATAGKRDFAHAWAKGEVSNLM